MYEELFLRKKPNRKKARAYGFAEGEKGLFRETEILSGTFLLRVTLCADGSVRTDLTERETGDEYVLYKTNARGPFVGSVREAVEEELRKISEACYDIDIFKAPQAKEIITYIKERFGDEPEFLWEKNPDNAIWRRRETAKWYGAILTVSRSRLGLDSEERTVILNLHIRPEEMGDLLARGNYYPGWHMNKKSWVTVILDGSVDTEEICRRIEGSYELAK